MPEQTNELVRLSVACDAGAPAVVRDALSRERILGSASSDAVLIASELVTNAVLHSGCAEDQPIEVRVVVYPEQLLISVRDPGRSDQTAQLRRDQTVGGWGLQIVDELAERWGSERDAGGHRVWAEVAWHPGGVVGGAPLID